MCCGTDRSARDANSLLRPNHPDEQVSLIPPHPDWSELTLGGLKNLDGPAVAKLASDQGLSPSEDSPDTETARIHNLNMVLRHLGVSCARLHPLLPSDPDQMTVNPFSDPLPGYSLAERHPPHVGYEKGGSLITPVEVPLYLFLAYLTAFVYSNIVL